MTGDRFALARIVADAVLYEGYVLYPYRASAAKNQIRWQFGVLTPPKWAAAEGYERSSCRTEVLVDPGSAPELHVRIRFLQVQQRVVEGATGEGFVAVDALPDSGVTHVAFEEAVEHEVDLAPVALLPVARAHGSERLRLPAGADVEEVPNGRLVRTRETVEGEVTVNVGWADGPNALLRVNVEIANTVDDLDPAVGREVATTRSLVAVHTLLAIDDGVFVSLLEPPEWAVEAAAGCRSEGCYPVLVGEQGEPTADVVLSSPIILYDHPAVAPESEGDMYDATEIDEILALRVMTLTGEEKAEARGTDARAAAIVDRCDTLPAEVFERLHGAIRSIEPAVPSAAPEQETPWWDPGSDASVDPFEDTIIIAGRSVGRGTKVVLRPSRRADAHDLFLAGMDATVAGVFNDVDGGYHLAVTIDDDPAAELYGSTGRFFYFAPEELELR